MQNAKISQFVICVNPNLGGSKGNFTLPRLIFRQ